MTKTIIISNRLPLTLKKEQGRTVFTKSAGGLATSLSSVAGEKDNIWIGWPGASFGTDDQEQVRAALHEKKMMPVFLSNEDVKLYYEGFSNSVIWPGFHYFNEYMVADALHWEAYKRVNHRFCEAVAEVYEPGDKIWVHDYHLLLLPAMIRQALPGSAIGFFLHIPFPSFEIFRSNPWRESILTGMLGCDLIGFQTYDDVDHFNDCVGRLLGFESRLHEIRYNNRVVTSDAFPIGIDYDKYAASATSRVVLNEIEKLKRTFSQTRLVLSVDRLDYSKGIPGRLRAIDQFFESYPEHREKVSFVIVMVPSRDQVFQYRRLKHEIDELVGKINGKYSVLGWHPVHYLYKQQPFKSLSALYAISDVAMVTPLRDGMNLVCKEYIASRSKGNGVLILSERAGAARTLTDALRVNPDNVSQMSEAIHEALTMPEEEQHEKISRMQALIRKYDVFNWAATFLTRLGQLKDRQPQGCETMNEASLTRVVEAYRKAEKCVLLFDYDGTLVGFTNDPAKAVPDPDLVRLMTELANDPRNRLYLITGRDRGTIGSWFAEPRIRIIAEHGIWLRKDREWTRIIEPDVSWKEQVEPILELFVDRTPGAFLEKKDYSFAWHYRAADETLGNLRARELKYTLGNLLQNINVQLLQGNKVIEIKSSLTNKGYALQAIQAVDDAGFILSIGDDTTDEDMFGMLPPRAYTIKVGSGETCARYHLPSWKDVRTLMERFAPNLRGNGF